jgi:hypothetical protein
MPNRNACFWFMALLAAGCGGGTSTPTRPTTSNAGTLQVAGTYQISQTAVDDNCGMSSAPVTFNGTVAHAPGATTFTLTDTVGTVFTGTVEANGNFIATATVGPDAGGQTYAERLEGRFSATGFSSTLRVTMTPRNCQFTRSWTAAKQGAPNIIP